MLRRTEIDLSVELHLPQLRILYIINNLQLLVNDAPLPPVDDDLAGGEPVLGNNVRGDLGVAEHDAHVLGGVDGLEHLVAVGRDHAQVRVAHAVRRRGHELAVEQRTAARARPRQRQVPDRHVRHPRTSAAKYYNSLPTRILIANNIVSFATDIDCQPRNESDCSLPLTRIK